MDDEASDQARGPRRRWERIVWIFIGWQALGKLVCDASYQSVCTEVSLSATKTPPREPQRHCQCLDEEGRSGSRL